VSRSGSGKPDPDLEEVELLIHQKGGSASFCAKMALSLNWVDPSCMNSITGSTCRAKCSKILHDNPNSCDVIKEMSLHARAAVEFVVWDFEINFSLSKQNFAQGQDDKYGDEVGANLAKLTLPQLKNKLGRLSKFGGEVECTVRCSTKVSSPSYSYSAILLIFGTNKQERLSISSI